MNCRPLLAALFVFCISASAAPPESTRPPLVRVVNLDVGQTASGATVRGSDDRLVTDYLTEAHAVPSPDDKRVLWASDWEAALGRPVGVYVAEFDPLK